MPWGEIIKLLIANAPAIIKTGGQFVAWATKTISQIEAATGEPIEKITSARLLRMLDHINSVEAQIQAID